MACLSTLRKHLLRDNTAPTHAWYFDGTAGTDDWNDTNTTAGITQAADTTDSCYGTQGMKVTQPAAATFNIVQDIPGGIDLSDGSGGAGFNGVLNMYLPATALRDGTYPGIGPRLLKIVMIASSTSYTVNKSLEIAGPNTDMNDEAHHSIPFSFSDFPSGLDWTDIERILLQVQWQDDANRFSPTFDRLALWPHPAKAKIYFIFHDGKEEHREWSQSCLDNGLTANIAVIPQNVGTPGYLSIPDLHYLHRQEIALCNHCNGITNDQSGDNGGWRWTDTNQDTLNTLAVRIAAIRSGEKMLRAWGFPEHCRTVVVPGSFTNPGSSAAEADSELVRLGHAHALWYAGAGQPMISTGSHLPRVDVQGQQEYGLRASMKIDSIDSGTAGWDTDRATTLENWVDSLVASKGECSFYCHTNHATLGITDAEIATLMAYVKTKVDAGVLEVGSISDMVRPRPRYDSGIIRNIHQQISPPMANLL